MLHDLAKDDSYVAFKQAVEDRRVETQRKNVKNLLFSRRLLMMMMTAVTVLRISSKFPQDVACQILLHSVDISNSYSKNEKGQHFSKKILHRQLGSLRGSSSPFSALSQ